MASKQREDALRIAFNASREAYLHAVVAILRKLA